MTDAELQLHIGRKIREIRKNKNISQMDVAYKIDMSMNTISYIELGKIAPKIDTLNKIANVLNVEISEFFLNKENNSNFEQYIYKTNFQKLKSASKHNIEKVNKIISLIIE